MSTGMRKWMEKGCPDIPTTPAEVSIGREELRQLRDELAQYKNERDALRAKVERMEKQEPVGTGRRARLLPRGRRGLCGRLERLHQGNDGETMTALDSTHTTAVDHGYHWQPMATCPKGSKVQLLTRYGCAIYGTWTGKETIYTGWAPLPTRAPEGAE